MPDEGVTVSVPRGKGFDTGKPLSEMTLEDVQNAKHMGGAVDPLAGRTISEEQGLRNAALGIQQNGRMRMSGIATTAVNADSVGVGDKVYHKTLKVEGKVTKILTGTDKVCFKSESGDEGKVRIKNLVKL